MIVRFHMRRVSHSAKSISKTHFDRFYLPGEPSFIEAFRVSASDLLKSSCMIRKHYQLACFRRFGADSVRIFTDLFTFAEAMGDKRGIRRYGDTVLPMDEALVLTAVDFSGRAYLSCELEFRTEKIGTFDTELVEEFWSAFVRTAACSLHIRQLAGRNSHHIAEAVFKSAARTFREAVEIDPDFADEIPSTKGVL